MLVQFMTGECMQLPVGQVVVTSHWSHTRTQGKYKEFQMQHYSDLIQMGSN